MKNNKYQKAVSHLRFSDDLYQRVLKNAPEPKRPTRILAALATAALITALLVTATLAVGGHFQKAPVKVEHTVPVQTLGTDDDNFQEAPKLEFAVSEVTGGVSVHYMELDREEVYNYHHGILRGELLGFQRITEDYRLEPVEMQRAHVVLEKNDRTYTADFTYLDTENGVISTHKSVYYKDGRGEILLSVTDGDSGQWAVYLDVETGAWRDALPEYTAADFEGRIGYVFELKGGLLVTTLVETAEECYNLYYWIGPGNGEPRVLEVPEEGWDEVYNNNLYFISREGHLYILDNDFTFRLISEYETQDMLTDGLLTVVTDQGKLGIFDVLTGETYVFSDISVTKKDLDEIHGYNARRYGPDGKIALIQADWRPQEGRVALLKLAVLDPETRILRMLEIENEYDGYCVYWLDKDRLAVMYETEEKRVFCIYEFE